MKTVPRRMIALAWACLLMVPWVSLAQTSKDAPASPQENKTAAPAQENQAAQAPQDNKTHPAPQNLPNAPSSSTSEPSLTDLGFPTEQTQGDAKQQALLDKRTHMLKIHQRMGLITTIPLIVTVATSLNAGGKSTSTASRDLHTALGGLTGTCISLPLTTPSVRPGCLEPKLAVQSGFTRLWLGFMAPE